MKRLAHKIAQWLKVKGSHDVAVTDEQLAQFNQRIDVICQQVKQQNLALVSNQIETSSGQNNAKLVHAAVYFFKECLWTFNQQYAKDYAYTTYLTEFIVYVKEVRSDFEEHHYDPDGVGAGTITDILIAIKEVSH